MFKFNKKLILSLCVLVGLGSPAVQAASVVIPNAPGPYIGVSPIAGSQTSVAINFVDNSDNEDGFRIFDTEDMNISIPENNETKNANISYILTDLVCDKVYQIQIVAHNSAGDSEASDMRAFNLHTTFGIPCEPDVNETLNAPGPTLGVTAIKGSKTSVRVNFLDNSDNEDGFRLFDGEGINVNIPPNNEMEHPNVYVTLTDLVCNRIYNIKAVAHKDGIESLASDTKSFRIESTFAISCDDNITSPDLVKIEIPSDKDKINKIICATIPDSTEVFQKVDIMFLVDISGSYYDDLTIFKDKANEIMAAFEAAGQDVQVSLASFSDFPISPYGSSMDYAFRLDQPLTNDFSLVTTAINNLTILSGSDYPESQLEGLFQSADNGTGWRDGALPIIFLATDADFHNSDDEIAYPGHGLSETVDTLVSKGIKVFGLQSGGSISDVIEIANLTDGSVFNLSSNSAEIVAAIESAIVGTSTDITVTLEAIGDDASIVESITPNIAGAMAGDPIYNVNAGDEVCFNIVFTRGAYTGEAEERIVYFELKVVAEGVATVKTIPVRVTLSPRIVGLEA